MHLVTDWPTVAGLTLYISLAHFISFRFNQVIAMKPDYNTISQSNSDEEIILELQSYDADSSSDDDASVDSSTDDNVNTATGKQLSPNEGTSSWKTTMNLVNYIEGIGFLSLPYAIKIGGITAVISLFVMPLICWYAGVIVVECLYDNHAKKGKIRTRSTWEELGDALVPKYGGKILAWNQDILFIILASSYLILCGSLMSHALPSVPLSQAAWTCCAAVIVLPTVFLKSYSQIAWLSTISVVAIGLTVAITLWYGVVHVNQWDPSTLLFWDFGGVFTSLALILYGYGAIPILPPVEQSMKDKTKFGKALAWAETVTMLFKLVLSLSGFFSFGFNTDEIVVNNFPAGIIRISVSVIFVISALLSYTPCVYPVVKSLEESSLFSTLTSNLSIIVRDAIYRLSLVMLSLALAVLLPHFALLTAFVGSIQSVAASIWIPFSLHLKIKYHELGQFQICTDVTILCLATLLSFMSIYSSGKALFLASIST